MATTTRERPGPMAVLGWWALTLLILLLLDDLTFGPAFWALSRLAGPAVAVVAIFAIYVPVQVLIVVEGTRARPGRVARFFLQRLDIERRSPHVARNEHLLRGKVLGGVSAVAASLVIGGIIPPMILYRRGATVRHVRRLSVLTGTVYAAEFATLHGLLPSLF